MLPIFTDTSSLIITLVGAFAAGFVTRFAGFGTALVSSGFWFHALAAPINGTKFCGGAMCQPCERAPEI